MLLLLNPLIAFLAMGLIGAQSLLANPVAFSPGALVNLRIEGLNDTIFSGYIFTRGHNVTTASSGTLHCDGTNNHMNPTPGPTATSALDDASKSHHFTFDGTIFESFDDFLITRIGRSANTDTEFWGLLLNFQFTSVGGCQQRVKTGDRILWAFDAFSKEHFLKLDVEDGRNFVRSGETLTARVTDGSTGAAIEGATIFINGDDRGVQTDVNGEAKMKANERGVLQLKAERDDSIRSNGVAVQVF